MSLKMFRIKFDHPQRPYTTGEKVTGTILLNNTEDIVTTGLYLYVEGWCQTFGSRQRTRNPGFNSENHLSEKYEIIVPKESDTQLTLCAGYYEYPFDFTLPTCIPSSIEHKRGYIRYTAKAVINIPCEPDQETECTFNVVSPLDLNEYREKCSPIDEEIIHTLRDACFFKPRELTLRIRVPLSGFTPGQSIFITVDHDNKSKETFIEKITAKLLREVTFYISLLGNRRAVDTSKIKSTLVMGRLPKCGQSILQLMVPDLPPSYLQHCKTISVEYILAITIHLSDLRCNIRKKYPIMIGTKPLIVNQENSTPIPMPYDSATTAPDGVFPTAPPGSPSPTSETTPLNADRSNDTLPVTNVMICMQVTIA
ncbi:arrestin domain-containing protein 17-like isoform X2 [Megachile rotundata]|uniref:arrestin domain-containing protein 17-like isoform X2 n=1 Tax=Megachile rotundata TaxID=143995 RepID=UPI003FCFC287